MQLFADLQSKIPVKANDKRQWNGLQGASRFIAIAEACSNFDGLCLLICDSGEQAVEAEANISFFLDDDFEILSFPDWETLPYDHFSPHQDIISQRLETLAKLPSAKKGLLICSISTLMHRLPTNSFIAGRSLLLNKGDTLDITGFRSKLTEAGYHNVDTVFERGEFAIRGSIIDIFSMGSDLPVRIELFDDEVETLRTFDPDQQRTIESIDEIKLLPAREFPFDDEAIALFKQNWQDEFDADPKECPMYQDIRNGIIPSGIEYYLHLFFDDCFKLFDFLPENTLLLSSAHIPDAAEKFWTECDERYENLRWDLSRPILNTKKVFVEPEVVFSALKTYPRIILTTDSSTDSPERGEFLFDSQLLPDIALNHKLETPLVKFLTFKAGLGEESKILISVESSGRRESLLEIFSKSGVHPKDLGTWLEIKDAPSGLYITVSDVAEGTLLPQESFALISENEIFGHRIIQQRKKLSRDKENSDFIIKNLTELNIGAPVVHLDHGIGRYKGLVNLTVDNQELELLSLEYASKAMLYVPVSSLHLISRYSGSSDEHAPLHSLGSETWQKAKRKASEKIRDVAAELLDIYARRAARKGQQHKIEAEDYLRFSAAFPFEETEDQTNAIAACRDDMISEQPMDRLICGDVGFGKTEVSMRAAFIAVQNHKQVAVLVPTTLLAEQHGQTFLDRFADWPIRVETISRFKSAKEQKEIIKALEQGKIDILVGTHKILHADMNFKELGLIIIDEEHRFGVRQKEKLKSLRSNVDILTLTATPIPRTLNMAMSGIRDISIIATPPAKRLSIKTFVKNSSSEIIKEAIHRELLRGGQVFFLHNEVSTIEKAAADLRSMIPESRVAVAHGQMREKQLENVMSEFYHKQANILVCSTIIETGIDIPSANTIIIERADKLGLAQIHQLRGRVGRSHHQAYAYLLIPNRKAISSDARKRLDAIEEATDLGAGFTLASHDMEIRGAGELLGDEQSGNMQTVGFSLYMEMLEAAVQSIKEGKTIDLDAPLHHGSEINLRLPALIPDDYLPDVHNRLIMYKRISAAKTRPELSELKVEMIDRFGLLPSQIQLLFKITELKMKAEAIGVVKIDAGAEKGKLQFSAKPKIDPFTLVQLVQAKPNSYKLDGADKLQFTFDMESYDDRIKVVNQLLDLLSK